MSPRRASLPLLLAGGLMVSGGTALAASALPPDDVVARVLQANPSVQAAGSQIRVEAANQRRLEAGQYEWNLRVGSQQRRAMPSGAASERFSEWHAALERPVRLPGKGALDRDLGAAGVAVAETARGDTLHETARTLLRSWFIWLREDVASEQWAGQVDLLTRQATGIRRRHQLGDAARLDTVQGDAAVAQSEAQLSLARVRRDNAAEDLRRRFPGLPVSRPATLPEPEALIGRASEWIDAQLRHSHELALARQETRRAQMLAGRSQRDRLPDPSIGMQWSRERAGEEQVVGAYISIPLPGPARAASSDAALAHADAVGQQEAAVLQKVSAEAATLYQATQAAQASWHASRHAAERLTAAADMMQRAYQLGEGSLNDLLAARRLANDAQLAARLSQLDALELAYRLQLDAHRLWAFDDGHAHED